MTTTAETAVRRTERGGPTTPPDRSVPQERLALWIRRGLVLLLVLVVAAALSGALGVHASTASAEGGGYSVDVRYAATARPGITVPLQVQVERQGGFTGPVQLALSSAYLDAVNISSLQPEPSESTSDGDRLLLTFDPVKGSTSFEVLWQAEVDPSADAGRHRASVSVLDGDTAVATARFTTWLWP